MQPKSSEMRILFTKKIKLLSITFLLLNLIHMQEGNYFAALDCLKTVTFMCTDIFAEYGSFVNNIASYIANAIAEVVVQ